MGSTQTSNHPNVARLKWLRDWGPFSDMPIGRLWLLAVFSARRQFVLFHSTPSWMHVLVQPLLVETAEWDL